MSIPLRIEKRECMMNNQTFYEKIDVDMLDCLIDSDLLKKAFNHKICENFYENEKEQLIAYKKLIKKGFANVKYNKVKNMDGWGRVNPCRALGLYNIRREIRQTLAKNNYVDIDMENAHPTILLQICQQNNINCSYLKEYVKNREEYLKESMKFYSTDRETVKKLFLRLIYLGGFDNWANDNNIEMKTQTNFIIGLKEELKKIGAIFNNEYKDLHDLIEKSKKSKNASNYNISSSVLSYVLQEWECQILETMYIYMTKKNYIKNRECILCADGIMIDKNTYKDELLNELYDEVFKTHGLSINFVKKDMDKDYLNEVNKMILSKENIIKEAKQELNKKTHESYLEIKNEVEKNYFFVEELSKFGHYDEEEDRFIIKNASDVDLCLKPYSYEKHTEKGIKTVSFYSSWIEDKERRTYKRIIFDPQNTDSRNFNLFTGFKLEKKPYITKSTEKIHKLLDQVLGEYKQYILEWLSFIIKNKKKTNVCIVLYSDEHGVGKNTIIELFIKLLDEKYTSKIEKLDNLAAEFNKNMENALFIYGDEILAKNKDLYTFLKNTITRSELLINKKGVDSYKIKDLCNYMFTTNDSIPFKIEEKDRRISMIQCSETKMTDKECNEYYALFEDHDLIASMFHELLLIETPNKIQVLNTKLKEEIQEVYISSPIKYLYKNFLELNNKRLSVQDMMDKIKDFEKSQGYTEIKTKKQLTISLNKIANFTFRTDKSRGYYFKDLDIELKKYNIEMYEDNLL